MEINRLCGWPDDYHRLLGPSLACCDVGGGRVGVAEEELLHATLPLVVNRTCRTLCMLLLHLPGSLIFPSKSTASQILQTRDTTEQRNKIDFPIVLLCPGLIPIHRVVPIQ